jgi:predicted Rossmann fold flavoprotein
LQEASRYDVDLRLNVEVKKLEKNEGKFTIHFANDTSLQSDYICVAAGGYAKPDMFNWLTSLGHTIAEPVPSLFTFNLPAGQAGLPGQEGIHKHPISALMGISVENTRVKIEGTKLVEEGPLLITHWGLSGPVILKLSAWGARELHKINYHFKVHINWMPAENDRTLKAMIQELRIESPAKKMINLNFSHLPSRLWEFFLVQSSIDPGIRLSELPAKQENLLIKNLVDYVAEVRGKTTFKEEFVTAGGIQLTEVDANTMMSKKVPGLFFAGEILDVDGVTGGFNFQHAWTSGFIAARAVGRT